MEFEDGTEAEVMANAIAQSMYAQCDPNGNQYLMIDSILDSCRSTNDFCYAEKNFVKNERTYRRTSESIWNLFFQWKYGSMSWKS